MPDDSTVPIPLPDADESKGMIDVEEFLRIVAEFEGHKGKMDVERAHIGQLIKDGEATHGLHRSAFKLAVKLRNMTPEQRADFLRGFDYYRRILNFDAQQELPLGQTAE